MRVQVKLCQSALALEAAQATDQQLRALFPRLSALPDLISQLRCGVGVGVRVGVRVGALSAGWTQHGFDLMVSL